MDKIDFVVLWVDGNDPAWLAERAKYLPDEDKSVTAVNRFRDWDLMRYWFRGVDKFAPWVNKVYFVTWGHYPEWLNLEHPKLKIIKHTDYIPHENLPTFNSNVIEIYLHKIPELSEHFVLFNDDMFLTNYVGKDDFFKNNLPRETVCLGQGFAASLDDVFSYTVFNNVAVINKHFSKKRVIRKYWQKFFSIRYGVDLIRTFLLLPFGHFSGFLDSHLPTSHLKSTFEEVWGCEGLALSRTGTHRFRNKEDLTHWLMKNWRFCSGQFTPRDIHWGKAFYVGGEDLTSAIKKQKYKSICANDCDENLDFEKWQTKITEAFEEILPNKSSFEK